jgi:hypothetical protein
MHSHRSKLLLGVPLFLVLLVGCTPPPASVPPADYRIFLGENDSLDCRILHGDILTTRIFTTDQDTVELNNDEIDRIVSLRSGRDVTDRYIDRNALKVELAKKEALKKREKLKAEIAAGKRKQWELDRVPFAVLSAEFERTSKGMPQVMLTILNLTKKKITLVKTRVYCFDQQGRPISSTKGRGHIFDASSRIPIEPGEDFTTTLVLRNHPKTRKATIEIHYLEFADRTWWKGKVEETVK